MAKSQPSREMGQLVAQLRPFLKERGFRARAATFNRKTQDGLTHVVQFQSGRCDPPGTNYIPGLRENLYGKFTINVGVFVPEVYTAEWGNSRKEREFVPEIDCCIRRRIGALAPQEVDVWWLIKADPETQAVLKQHLERDVLPFLAKFETRNALLSELRRSPEASAPGGPPRVTCAIILASRGQAEEAGALLKEQSALAAKPSHTEYLRQLARTLGIPTP
jgi:Domain of unknown function (DUF4304)